MACTLIWSGSLRKPKSILEKLENQIRQKVEILDHPSNDRYDPLSEFVYFKTGEYFSPDYRENLFELSEKKIVISIDENATIPEVRGKLMLADIKEVKRQVLKLDMDVTLTCLAGFEEKTSSLVQRTEVPGRSSVLITYLNSYLSSYIALKCMDIEELQELVGEEAEKPSSEFLDFSGAIIKRVIEKGKYLYGLSQLELEKRSSIVAIPQNEKELRREKRDNEKYSYNLDNICFLTTKEEFSQEIWNNIMEKAYIKFAKSERRYLKEYAKEARTDLRI